MARKEAAADYQSHVPDGADTASPQRSPATLLEPHSQPSVSTSGQASAGVPEVSRGGVPEVVTGGVPGQATDAASHDCIALGSVGGEVDVHSTEEQSEPVRKVCTSWLLQLQCRYQQRHHSLLYTGRFGETIQCTRLHQFFWSSILNHAWFQFLHVHQSVHGYLPTCVTPQFGRQSLPLSVSMHE